MMTRAESCLDNLIKSVEKGTVTVATLKFLEEHSDQYFKLVEIHKMTQKVSISIEDSFSQRRRELQAFLTLRKHVECFTYFSDKFTSGISVINLFSARASDPNKFYFVHSLFCTFVFETKRNIEPVAQEIFPSPT
jgi:hypothetical protein